MAIRGGIPVIFPQFSSRGSLPRHGVARDRAWEMHAGTDHDGAARVDATLTDDPTTRELWPHAFRLTLQALARGHTLDVTLAVENEGATPLTFCAALHTYLRVRDTAEARIEGLGGHTAHDSADDVSPARLLPEALPAQGPVDLAVRGVGGPVRVVDPVTGTVEVTAEGFADRVLWNPGPAHGLADVPAGGASGFVCVEPASLTPLVLAPGATWQGGMRLEVPT
jgi:glucose-6-phosphate 1-epimerase